MLCKKAVVWLSFYLKNYTNGIDIALYKWQYIFIAKKQTKLGGK